MSVAAAREPDNLPPDLALTVTARSGPAPAVSSRRHRAVKRILDLVLASLALVVAIPVGLVIAIVVKLTSRGPAFFVQERVGLGGEPFGIIKFRTMRSGTHLEVITTSDQRQQYFANGFKLPRDDQRITRVGRALRITSLDELPQLINVLRGDMSLVGIRAMEAAQVGLRGEYERLCYEVMKPGITGLWQVSGRSSLSDNDRRRLDCEYVEGWSLAGDLRILARTPAAVVRVQHAT